MIQPLFNGMIAIMLTKFMFNDVPHYLFEDTTMRELKVTRMDERDATSAQLRLIAIKSAKLKIPEPTVKKFGEAGLMIRELGREEEYRKRLKGGGNPGTKTFYHVTPKENLSRIMKEGLYAPVHILTSETKAHEWCAEVKEYEPAVIFKVMLPEDWPVYDDPLHPRGTAMVSDKHIPVGYVALLRSIKNGP